MIYIAAAALIPTLADMLQLALVHLLQADSHTPILHCGSLPLKILLRQCAALFLQAARSAPVYFYFIVPKQKMQLQNRPLPYF